LPEQVRQGHVERLAQKSKQIALSEAQRTAEDDEAATPPLPVITGLVPVIQE